MCTEIIAAGRTHICWPMLVLPLWGNIHDIIAGTIDNARLRTFNAAVTRCRHALIDVKNIADS